MAASDRRAPTRPPLRPGLALWRTDLAGAPIVYDSTRRRPAPQLQARDMEIMRALWRYTFHVQHRRRAVAEQPAGDVSVYVACRGVPAKHRAGETEALGLRVVVARARLAWFVGGTHVSVNHRRTCASRRAVPRRRGRPAWDRAAIRMRVIADQRPASPDRDAAVIIEPCQP